MRRIAINFFTFLFIALVSTAYGQSRTVTVDHFNEIIISPHIEVSLTEGNSESVTVTKAHLPEDKIHIEVSGKTLRVYLEGAKLVAKREKIKEDGWETKRSIYTGTMAVIEITYKELKALSLRGEEKYTLNSPLHGDKFKLTTFGEAELNINEANLEELHAVIYGDTDLKIHTGSIKHQRVVTYGESRIDLTGVRNETSRVKSYGASKYRLHVSEHLKVTSYGEVDVRYKGNPTVNKGIMLGESTIRRDNSL